jgi:hypothetical protein
MHFFNRNFGYIDSRWFDLFIACSDRCDKIVKSCGKDLTMSFYYFGHVRLPYSRIRVYIPSKIYFVFTHVFCWQIYEVFFSLYLTAKKFLIRFNYFSTTSLKQKKTKLLQWISYPKKLYKLFFELYKFVNYFGVG